jgi:N-acetylmuramoyl-L-alanine amidase
MKIKLTVAAAFIAVFSFVVYGAQNTVPPVADATESSASVGKIVVIDAGHGGGEWGVSASGSQEKIINLRNAELVKKKIEKADRSINVILTRSTDEYIKTQDRAGFANSKNADMFVSIHCDYLPQEKVSGYKVYYSDSGEKPQGGGIVTKWDDIQKAHEAESKKAADIMSQYLQAALMPEPGSLTQENDLLALPSRGVAAAPIYTLNGVDMPAIVVEAGNLNNKQDAGTLKDDKVLMKIAYHIKEGIMNYIKDVNPKNGAGGSR